jgi:hypothetical protein
MCIKGRRIREGDGGEFVEFCELTIFAELSKNNEERRV